MSKLRVVFFGTPSFAVPVLEKLAQNFQLVGVVTAPDQKVGRKQLLTPSPVKLASSEVVWRGCKVLTPAKLDKEVAEQIQSLEPDLIVVAAYGKIIPQAILDIPKYGALNIHPSALPKYRGPSPIQAAILNGDKESAMTVIKMDQEMDHGPIISTKEIILSDQDTFGSLSKKMFEEAVALLVKIIPDFVAGKIKPVAQNHAMATFCATIKKEDGYFEITNPPSAEELDRMIRAYYPWPNAWTRWSFDSTQDKNGKIVKFYPGGLVQMEGKKPVKLADFLHGYPAFPLRDTKPLSRLTG